MSGVERITSVDGWEAGHPITQLDEAHYRLFMRLQSVVLSYGVNLAPLNIGIKSCMSRRHKAWTAQVRCWWTGLDGASTLLRVFFFLCCCLPSVIFHGNLHLFFSKTYLTLLLLLLIF